MIYVLIPLLSMSGCSEGESTSSDFSETGLIGAPNDESSFGGGEGVPGEAPVPAPAIPEMEWALQTPQLTSEFVVVADESLDQIALVHVDTLEISTLGVGDRPTLVRANPTAEIAVALCEGSQEVALINPKAPARDQVRLVRIAEGGFNAIRLSPASRYVVSYFDAELALDPLSPSSLFSGDPQSISIIQVQTARVLNLSVSYDVNEVHFSEDENRLTVITEDYLHSIQLDQLFDDPTGYDPSDRLSLGDIDAIDREVIVTQDGQFGISRDLGHPNLQLISIEERLTRELTLSAPLTDIDVTPDQTQLILVSREGGRFLMMPIEELITWRSPESLDVGAEAGAEMGAETGTSAGTEAGAEAGMSAGTEAGAEAGAEVGAEAGTSAGTEAGAEVGAEAGAEAGMSAGTEAGMNAGTEAGMSAGTEAGTTAGTEAGTTAGTEAGTTAGTEAGTTAGTEAGIEAGTSAGTEETRDPLDTSDGLPWIFFEDLWGAEISSPGQVLVEPDRGGVVFFTTATPSTTLLRYEIATKKISSHSLSSRKSIRGAQLSPSGEWVIIKHEPETGGEIAQSHGFSLARFEETPPHLDRITLTDTEATHFSFDRDRILSSIYPHQRSLLLIDLNTLAESQYTLGSPPVAMGPIPESTALYIAQDHPTGRMTFLNWTTQELRTVTGFQLNSRVR